MDIQAHQPIEARITTTTSGEARITTTVIMAMVVATAAVVEMEVILVPLSLLL